VVVKICAANHFLVVSLLLNYLRMIYLTVWEVCPFTTRSVSSNPLRGHPEGTSSGLDTIKVYIWLCQFMKV
jgi:hypothetical protein